MSTKTNRTPFLREQRSFPQESQPLSVEIDRAYTDIAQAVNSRVLGIFAVGSQVQSGESWFLVNQKQQALRQVFTFTTTASITHNIRVTDANQFTRCFGSYTDGTNSYGLIFGTSVAVAGLITFYVTSTQIVFAVGAGAPAISSGRVVLEFIV